MIDQNVIIQAFNTQSHLFLNSLYNLVMHFHLPLIQIVLYQGLRIPSQRTESLSTFDYVVHVTPVYFV